MSTTTASSALDKDPDTNLYGKKDRRFRSKVEARTAGRKAADWGNFSRSGIDELVSSAGSHEFLPGSFVSIKNIGVFESPFAVDNNVDADELGYMSKLGLEGEDVERHVCCARVQAEPSDGKRPGRCR